LKVCAKIRMGIQVANGFYTLYMYLVVMLEVEKWGLVPSE